MKSNRFTLALILLAVMPILFYGCKQAQTPEEPAYDTIALEPEPEPEPEPELEEESEEQSEY